VGTTQEKYETVSEFQCHFYWACPSPNKPIPATGPFMIIRAENSSTIMKLPITCP
jgi:hypothetical protein